ncbi:MAG: hypothetical protein RBU21_07645 [FCB group bacterium]|jgi:hypothetical protein|nr:hypothetical protein [FCB group bacterium]
MKTHLLTLGFAVMILNAAQAGAVEPRLRLETDAAHPQITVLSWDTEGGNRVETNLLRAPAGLRVLREGAWSAFSDQTVTREGSGEGEVVYRSPLAVWSLDADEGELEITVSCSGAVQGLELVFPFNPRVTPTTLLPSGWQSDGRLDLPAIVSAPDFGQLLLTASGGEVHARLEGSRPNHEVDLILDLSAAVNGKTITLELEPVHLRKPKGLKDNELWRLARRGWFNEFQISSKWGDPNNAFSAPPGMLANNVISDPASCSLWFYADQALFTSTLAEGVDAMPMVRRTLDWWLDEKVLPDGQVICYWDKKDFLDANASPLIAAWDYVEVTKDREWLERRIERLEFIAEYLVKRDIDGDGMIEAVQSGNPNALQQPGRSCAWWDALNCGHKDAYTNAVCYRAFRCLADLEAQLGRTEKQTHYAERALALKASYFKTLYNPETGWIAWWRDANGQLHDYHSPVVNGLAIEYGLVEPEKGREILDKLWKRMEEAGFTRFDLGVPGQLIPVLRADYLQPDACGMPTREDGTDTFGYYMNGGITAGHVLHFMAAHYAVGMDERGDKVLRAMLERQQRGEFQNGVTDSYPKGIDWTTWDGKPAGYEGYLADNFRFLQAVVLREPEFRARLYRPMMGK